VAAWLARLAFPILLLFGWMRAELSPKSMSLFVFLGLVAWIRLPRIAPNRELFVTSVMAVLDVVLVLVVFKGDVKLG
jgi:hypothetical protein